MLISILSLVGGLALILVGANLLTDGSSAVARRWGVSELVIGLTIVAFGTSAPELVITLMSALRGSTELAIGNVVGSNIFNVLVIIGAVAMVRPMRVGRSTMCNELPMVFLSSLALLAIGNGVWLDGDPEAEISRVSGLLLLLFFAIFMRYTFHQARAGAAQPAEGPAKGNMGGAKATVWIVAGLAGLIFGGNLFVDGASAIASAMGVSEAVIGLTIVAIGTSLPELATSLVAATKGKADLAVGNVIGSNIFNVFLVAGAGAVVRPLQFGSIGNVDLLTLAGACLLFWAFGRWGGQRVITRAEGAVLLVGYVAYTAYLIATA
ncbi:MAG: calcium/sodium antiporter [Pseudoflavonifractor sp.]|nr:calcium/sodium antiporter [Alloprevotella sp.]MCM1117416.1 calcium/sodium antiporter [Pseudoflavonifractor sp.]